MRVVQNVIFVNDKNTQTLGNSRFTYIMSNKNM